MKRLSSAGPLEHQGKEQNMLGKSRVSRRSIAICFLLAVAMLWGVAGALARAEAVDPTSMLAFLFSPADYGVTYLYPHLSNDWYPSDRDAMEAALREVKDLGVTTVIQTFPQSLVGDPTREDHWLLFLDAAEEVGIDVVAYLWPSTVYPNVGDPFDYDDLKAFIDVVGDHPALIGYVGLHEPLEPSEGISEQELKDFYTEMKTYAPSLKIAHFMGNISYWDENRTDWDFSDGVCDICMIYYFPFRYLNGDPVYEQDIVLSVVEPNVEIMAERDPDAELWFLGQAFEQSAHYRNLRMPTPEEMKQLYWDVMQYPVDGFMWYSWQHTDQYDALLGDPGMEEQQEAVGNIVFRTYLPVLMKGR
jgi:hypothetical protein